MNSERKKNILRVLWVASVCIAFLLGVLLAGRRFIIGLPRLTNTVAYNDHVRSAAHYAQILLDARQGNTNALIQKVEKYTDTALLMACDSTDAWMRVMESGPWNQLKKDRMDHPRQNTSPERETRINEMLEILIKEQPQQSAPPLPRAPQAGHSEGAR